ncbi:MAG: DNA gyrase subunit A [Deltaproteobacteria bacterium]|nr:DNA gyrase subunit A [Deltaproteobacteria bacterium]
MAKDKDSELKSTTLPPSQPPVPPYPHTVNIDEEMRNAYLDYAMSVIVGRALPDVRDGLKPVHRRALYAMEELGNAFNKAFKKSARVVGDIIGKYHPHGDAAVYMTIVRMAQDFSMRYPLVDGQGNFGSIDGDNPAHMRYTEVRMAKITGELLADLDKETVDFVPNYDGSLKEPSVLPAKIPNLLINGSSGIAVGMATNIPPHNVSEVLQACVTLIDAPETTVADLVKIIPGPDFPTAGFIYGKKGLKEAYLEGRGIIQMRAKAEIEEVGKGDRERIVVTELPYQVNKAKLIEGVADLVKNKRLDGISDIRDESDRKGMRIVFDVRKGAQAAVLLNQLFKMTPMQSSFGIIMLALDNNVPRVLNLKEMLQLFIGHRKDVITRRTAYELKRAEERAHILEGLKIAIENIDPVIALIKKAKDPQIAKVELMGKFKLSDKQAQAILELRLQRLTGLERDKIIEEFKELLKMIQEYKDILGDEKLVLKIIKTELGEILKNYGDKRRTKIIAKAEEVSVEDLIEKEDVVVTVTQSGYIKRHPLEEYRAQHRGGKGVKGMGTREEDFVSNLFVATTHSYILCFTNIGKLYWLRVHEVPETSAKAGKGKAIVNLLNLGHGEKLCSVLPIEKFEEGKFVMMATRKGIVKKTDLMEYSNIRLGGLRAIKIEEGDILIGVEITDGKKDIFLSTAEGQSIRFNESQVRSMGRIATGVWGIRLEKTDEVVGMEVLDSKKAHQKILTVTERGYGKRTDVDEYRSQTRGGKGIITIKTTERNGKVVGMTLANDSDDILIITDQGQVIRMNASSISVIGRNTAGVRLIHMEANEKVVAVSPVIKEEEQAKLVDA